MKQYEIDVLCLQETWLQESEVYGEQGYLVVLSGSDDTERSWAGVGFILAPHCRSRVKAYRQVSDRIAYVKLRVTGGVAGIISAYTPHNLKPLPERVELVEQLDGAYRKCTANLGRIVLGDLNARIGAAQPGEDDIFGPFIYGRALLTKVEVPIANCWLNCVTVWG